MKTYKIDERSRKYRFGAPIETESLVINSMQKMTDNTLKYFKLNRKKNQLQFIYKMSKSDIVLGLGENQRGMNKRGGLYESFCSDDPVHTPDKKSLYGAHNFFILDGAEKFGIFVDYPSKVIFDIGFSQADELNITIEDENLDLYIIEGEGPKEIVEAFLVLLGDSYVPPKWAFGYQQSRWSYPDSKEIERIADSFLQNKIPCDAIYLDIDYMEAYKDFTIDEKRFPEFKEFVEKIKNKGFRLIPIIDAGVKIEDDYIIYEEGKKNDFFCVDEDDTPFVAAVWPGKVHFPDFLNPEARRWFGLKYKLLIDNGIEGFWNDMNEPAIFYTEDSLKKAISMAKDSEDKNLDINSYFNLKDQFSNLINNVEDYKRFYHKIDGKKISHYDVHNLYGHNMTRSAAEGFKEIDPNKRFLLFSRASYIGMGRYGGIWTGDNHSWWQHILLNIKMMPALNMCGFLYIGADTGGFSGDANSQLLIRWSQFSIFTPLFRNHSALGTRSQEPYAFDDESTNIMKKVIELRYSLIPYIYSEYMKAAIKKILYFMPLSFEYKDEMSKRVEDQLLVGDSLMITPIYEENAIGRYVWLPEDMLLCKIKSHQDTRCHVYKKGHAYIDVELEETPMFIRKDKMMILGKPAQNVEKINLDELKIIAFIEDGGSYTYFDDDGSTHSYKDGNYSEILIEIKKKAEEYIVDVENKGNYMVKKIHFEIIDIEGNVIEKTVNLTK
ncbi:TIM-barrel domain-containing protein [Alkaliphilus peptidifermentans]|uniref:Alpha-glucosidase n=1 Tax=Alkaliphilus peptidifermentans DSM 18978 TaxID=1120976 RepID=A0A1G5J326_9FIRM|nr:TIM-barrel domain-containing protein [Alkaliphilus peptidifermentans]SCY82657.1 alpha-glucosidase [Alkaliphilus peptidifermentans DSM 18978]